MSQNPLLKAVGPGEEMPGFDIDDPLLPADIDMAALASGGYPYPKRMKGKKYLADLEALQIELLKLQMWVRDTGQRLVIVFEGRDAAGKGGTIRRFMEHLPPRHARAVALPKPTETERHQWYFQRYVAQLPSGGNMLLFDRSWYNRGGVERVMGFCTETEFKHFLEEAPLFEAALIRDGLILRKLWLDIGREMQLKRFHVRRHHMLKRWKLNEIDIAGLAKWDAYSAAWADIFRYTNTVVAPWTILLANDKRRTRLNAMRAVLSSIDYAGKDPAVASAPDPLIVRSGAEISDTAP